MPLLQFKLALIATTSPYSASSFEYLLKENNLVMALNFLALNAQRSIFMSPLNTQRPKPKQTAAYNVPITRDTDFKYIL